MFTDQSRGSALLRLLISRPYTREAPGRLVHFACNWFIEMWTRHNQHQYRASTVRQPDNSNVVGIHVRVEVSSMVCGLADPIQSAFQRVGPHTWNHRSVGFFF